MLELLTSGGANIATDLLERTASTLRVQEIVRLSLAPAFLLAAIGAVMNVIMARLIWIANRIDRLTERMADERSHSDHREMRRLQRRRRYAQRSIMFATAAALTISLTILLLFVSAFIEPQIGTLTAIAWIATMVFLITGLMLFAAETVIAASGQKRHGPDEGS
ncbi:DUF2721 domain-containing protein [Altererythrobacter sp.]|nr:DUF2721 domain-containing protein [Altererythrobacter sp.]